MKNFDTRTYNISDFVEWEETGLLELSPDFQRRYVWSEKAKSYLIDTIIRGKPIPKIIIQQQLQGKRNIRIVVDGQQRLRTLLGYYKGDFKINRVHNREFASKSYDQLPEDIQKEFLQYELGVDLLFDMPYEDILDIFARLNSYTAKLTPQEQFNARYVGHFKQVAFKYGLKYVNYLIEGKVLTKAQVTRMKESEMAADLLVAIVDEVQSNKKIESYYKKYEEEEGSLYDYRERFDSIMINIGAIYPAEDLANTNYNRTQLFYTLFTTIGHSLYGLGGLDQSNRFVITDKNKSRIRIILDEVSGKFDAYVDDPDYGNDEKFKQFVRYSQRGTTDTGARVYRTNYLSDVVKTGLNS